MDTGETQSRLQEGPQVWPPPGEGPTGVCTCAYIYMGIRSANKLRVSSGGKWEQGHAICVVPLFFECCFCLCSACNGTDLKSVVWLWLAMSVQFVCFCMEGACTLPRSSLYVGTGNCSSQAVSGWELRIFCFLMSTTYSASPNNNLPLEFFYLENPCQNVIKLVENWS